eukprot:comp20721_c0_seq1/m.27070 comp20721_c0_seq1/g.27070  ORF comp20721_c0_seq1/g.27070 comp20721_c0_seq1/m.27070 type:complete len:606 (-) comp20721_c0_seq1:170-1987(-)
MGEVRGQFDPSGELYATLSADGRLRVWETATGNMRQEHTPATHLSDTFTCLAWGSAQGKKSKKGSKKIQSSSIALGTTTGKIVVYSLAGGVQSAELAGHTDRVNDVVFSKDGTTIFSCSADKQIIHWDLATGQPISQWKGDTHAVTGLQLSADGSFLLAAGRTIKAWDVATKKATKKYTGHENPVSCISFTPSEGGFVTMAAEDRFLFVWECGEDAKTTAVATLSMEEAPVAMTTAEGKVCRVLAVTAGGILHVWQPDFDKARSAKKAKPLVPGATITVVAKGDKSKWLPVIGATFAGEPSAPQVLLVRGSILKPVFETVSILDDEGDELKSSIVLERDPSAGLLLDKESETKRPKGQREDVKVIGAGDMALPTAATTDRPKKKQQDHTAEMTIEERLAQMAAANGVVESTVDGEGEVPKADSLARLLIQALHSGDNQLLEECLSNSTEAVIKNTVKRLPAPHVIPFLQRLIEKFQARPNRGLQLVPWMKATILSHTNYLVTVPDLPQTVGGLYQMVDSRLAVFNKLLALNGRLDLLLSQVTVRGQAEGVDEVAASPEAVYEEEDTESSGDEDDEDEMVNGDSGEESEGDAMDLDGEEEEESDEE